MTRALALCLLLVLSATRAPAEDIDLTLPDATLAGTWLTPDDAQAAAMILPGSGPTDRDGNSPAGLSTDAYRLLSQALLDRDIATIRADKRGIGASTGDPNAVTLDLYAQDAGGWIDLARARSGLACLWLIGHSEGALVALRLAETRDDICGLILLAPPGRPVSQILLEQLRGIPALAPHLPAAEKAIFSLISGRPVDVATLPAPLQGVFNPAVQPFLMDLFAVDSAKAAAGIDLPALVIRGSADLQIAAEDATRLAEAFPDAAALEIPDMTHVLKRAKEASRAANLATYSDPKLPLAPGLVDAVASFLLDSR